MAVNKTTTDICSAGRSRRALCCSLVLLAVVAGPAAADEIDDDIALFEDVCLAPMPKAEAISDRATTEKWPALDRAELKVPSYDTVKVEKGWTLERNGVRYTVRMTPGNAELKMTGNDSGLTHPGCSFETKRGNGADIVGRLAKKYGASRGPFLKLLRPDASEIDATWNIDRDTTQIAVTAYRPKDGAPGARLSVTATDPSFFKR